MAMKFKELVPCIAVGLAAGAIVYYLTEHKKGGAEHHHPPHPYYEEEKHKEDHKNKKKKIESHEDLVELLEELEHQNPHKKRDHSGLPAVHRKRGTIKLGHNNRREVEIDDGFDPSDKYLGRYVEQDPDTFLFRGISF